MSPALTTTGAAAQPGQRSVALAPSSSTKRRWPRRGACAAALSARADASVIGPPCRRAIVGDRARAARRTD
jgi:hypothetical protein